MTREKATEKKKETEMKTERERIRDREMKTEREKEMKTDGKRQKIQYLFSNWYIDSLEVVSRLSQTQKFQGCLVRLIMVVPLESAE